MFPASPAELAGRSLANTSNGQVGEAFFFVSPDGTKYWFDHLTGERALTMKEQDPYGSGTWLKQHRMLARMYVSRIEDRFGNSLTYIYAGDRLTDITASDGRHVRIDWGGDRLIDSIWVQPGTLPQRIWQYHYAGGPKLIAAILPDQSRWTFDLQGLGRGPPPPEELSYCSTRTMPDPIPNPTLVSTVTSPSGLVGRFGVRAAWHARSYVASNCREPELNRGERAPSLFQSTSLVSKEFSGPGMATRTWGYRYSPAVGSALFDPCALANPQTCADTKWVEVSEPNGDMTRHVHSNRWGPMEGKRLWTETFAASAPSTLVRKEIFEYALPTHGPYPARVGYNMVMSDSNTEPQETLTPLRKRTIYQQERLFVWEVNAFDEYANTVITTRSSNVGAGYARSDSTVYAHYLNLWVIGRAVTSTHLATGRIEFRTVYDSMGRPERTYSHEMLQQTVKYNTNGTIASVSDGRDTDNFNTTITLSDWKRGIPQSIQFPPTPDQPSGTRKSAEVDDHGWIKATIDENTYRTEYDHDAMGRLTQLRPPTGDSVAWNPTHQSFVQSTPGDAAFGIPGGHWRQTTSTGHARKVVYFDAQWRPVLTHEFDNQNQAATARFTAASYDTNGRQTYASYAMSQSPAMSNGYWTGYMGGTPLIPYNPNDPPDPPEPPEPPLPEQSTLPGTYTVHDALDRATVTTQTAEAAVTVRTVAEYLPGFQTRVTNARNKPTTTSYMAYDQPGTEWPVAIAHPADSYTDISRDAFGAPLTVTRRNGGGSVTSTRKYVYGIHQQLCKTIEPETGATVMAYDAASNLAWSASGQGLTSPSSCDHSYVTESDKVHRSYDARNRLKTLRFPDTRGDQDWEYLPDGLPRKVSTRNVTTPGASQPTNLYAYNKRRMLTTETLALPAWYTWSIGYAYDANGSLASQTYPSGQTVNYAPNALGQATQVSGDVPYASNVSYHPNGAIAAFGYGNGLTHRMTPNARQLPEEVVDQGVLHMRYSYDANGNVDAIADLAQAGRQSRTMTYDDPDRLKTAASPMFGPVRRVRLRRTGQPDRVRAPAATTATYDAKWQLHDISNTGGPSVIGLGYDVRGNVINKSGMRFDFDHGNRLRETSANTGVVIERYRYDAAGRRILANRMSGPPGSTGVVLSQYAQNGQLMYQSSDRTATGTDHIYLGGSLIAQREQPTSGAAVVKYIHTDALGSPVAVTNANGTAILELMEYEPYGKGLFGGSGTTAPKDGPGYTGHVLDVATGMNYMQQRYYDPGIGRFLSVDPVAAKAHGANFNRYGTPITTHIDYRSGWARSGQNRMDPASGRVQGAD